MIGLASGPSLCFRIFQASIFFWRKEISSNSHVENNLERMDLQKGLVFDKFACLLVRQSSSCSNPTQVRTEVVHPLELGRSPQHCEFMKSLAEVKAVVLCSALHFVPQHRPSSMYMNLYSYLD
jgi:hypothetical protein